MSLIDSNTVRVKRGGSFLTIPKLALERYVAKGYALVDNAGNIVQSETSTDWKNLYEQQVIENKILKARIKELEKKSAKDEEPKAVDTANARKVKRSK